VSDEQTIHPGTPRATVQAKLPDGRIFEAAPGTPLEDILRVANGTADVPVVAAIVGNKLTELTKPLLADAEVQPVTAGDLDGLRIYRRSLVFLLVVAAAELYPEAEIFVEHSASHAGGYFCEVRGRGHHQPMAFTQTELHQIEAHMRTIVEANERFTRAEVPMAEAIALFRARGQDDTASLLSHRTQATIALYTLRSRTDFAHGYLTPSTGYLRVFNLHAMPSGFVLQMPQPDRPEQITPISPYPILFQTFEEAGNWLDRLGLRSAGALNDDIAAGRLPEISLVSEALHEARVAAIATEIAEQRDRIRLVLVAGPSASGKTTFAKRLSVQLLANGLRPFPLSIDDYFLNREQTPLDDKGRPDFESLRAVDVALFNEHLLALLSGQTVRLPHYNFKRGAREAGMEVTLGPGHMIVIEGIHGLNPALVPGLPPESVYRIYISALTQLNLDRHNRVSTTDTRLIRRIVRDAATRGYTATDTLRRWESVTYGERLHIFPYQENGDAIFNSALAHELAVLRPFAEPLLLQVRPETPEYLEAKRLLAFLRWFRPAPADAIPSNSILREFIGGSTLEQFTLWPGGSN
jgi:uridine kinase